MTRLLALLLLIAAAISAAAPVPFDQRWPSVVGTWQVADWPMECDQFFTFGGNGHGDEAINFDDGTYKRKPFTWKYDPARAGRVVIDGHSYAYTRDGDRLTLHFLNHEHPTVLRKRR